MPGEGGEALLHEHVDCLLSRYMDGIEHQVYRYAAGFYYFEHKRQMEAEGYESVVLTWSDSFGCVQISYTRKSVGGVNK